MRAPRHNLPVQPTPLIGRDRPVTTAVELLQRDDVRLLTVTGAAGVGKSRLAIAACSRAARLLEDGVWFVDLAAVDSPDGVLAALGRTLGLREARDTPGIAQGDTARGIGELEAAVAIQDSLAYIEPPAWFYPVRHSLGAAVLDAGRHIEAEAIYHEDLRQYPNNGWSLFGLAQSLREQGKAAEALEVQQRFVETWKRADVTLTASRY